MQSIVIGTYEPGTFVMKYYLKNFPYESALFQLAMKMGMIYIAKHPVAQ